MKEEKNKIKNKGGRPKKLTLESFKKVVDEYIAFTIANERIPFKYQFCAKYGISEDTLARYKESDGYAEQVKRLELHAKSALLDRLQGSKQDANAIYLGKSMFGWSDQLKVDVTSNGETLGVVQLPPNPDKK